MRKPITTLFIILGLLAIVQLFVSAEVLLGAQTLLFPSRIATTTGSAGNVLMISNGAWVPAATSSSSSFTSAATTTVTIDTTSSTQGGCLKMKNATGTEYTYMTVGYGVAIFSTNSCE